MKKIYIDPHVHFRIGKQSIQETILSVLEAAASQGIAKVFDMPNTDPPITTEEQIRERLELVPKGRMSEYHIWVGLTYDPEQIKEAVKCVREYNNVIGMKLYAGSSTGNLSVIEKEDQRTVYKTLVESGYKGVIAVHCDKESLMRPDFWDPKNPITHTQARPKEAEVESIRDQIELVKETGFSGTIHICHVSCPEAMELIEEARKVIRITCGVTPHHIMWTDEMLMRPDGLLYKMNPPLRDKESVEELRKYLVDGKIDWIETDHAPHHISEKFFAPYLSGYPTLYLYKDFVENYLPSLGVSKELIEKMTSGNILKTFGDKLK
jgi:dihydroorotase